MMPDYHLCIGGPLAGHRHEEQGDRFSVAVTPKTAIMTLEWYETIKREVVEYRLDCFRTPQGDVRFWVPYGQTPLQTMEKLMEGYAVACLWSVEI